MNELPDSRDPNIPVRAAEIQDSSSAAESSEVTRESPDGLPVVRVPSGAGTTSRSAFGRYEVRRSLGAGGFGEVYLGHDTQLDRSVAIKVLRAGFAPLLTETDPTLQEARKLAHLRHPGIVAVHDIGVHAGQMYVVTDFVDGPDLHHWLRDNHPPWLEAARIIAAIADALSHAHARRIVHRDIKPSNIILTADRAPVLVDFGIALGEEQAGGARGRVSGTPWYMSPEQAQGTAHRIDGRTDVYSLGVVLYELLTGRVPFSAPTIPELMRQVCDDEPQPPRQLVRDIPPELERVCLRAMAKRQHDRYTTAADFAEDLRRVLMTAAGSPALGPTPIETPAGARPPPGPTPTPTQTDSGTPAGRRSSRAAERRHLTVLVAGSDVFESDAYLQLDSEDQARVLQVFQDGCNEAVRQFGGTVVQFTDKGLVACFGFPVAYEDAAARAACAGLAIVETIKRSSAQIRRQDTLTLQPWVGIHTGAAVVESKADAVSLVGDARNVAVRLGHVALAGQVICTNDSQRLFRGQVACVSLGQQKIKSAAHPVELFRIDPITLTGSPIDAAAPAELSPLTGRDQEMGLLTDRWEQAREGMGQTVLLIGEAGLGKSRLVHTLKEHVLGLMKEGDVDAPVIEWRCSPHYQNTGLHPAIDYYERALRFRPEEPPEDRVDRMLQRLEQYGLVRPETAPLWASLLSLPTPDRFPPLALSPVRQREETFRAMLEWLHMRAARKPILFIVEDLHWVDASTLEFLGQFLAEGLHESILTLLTFRPEFKTPWPAVAHQTSLALNRLTRRQVGELMTKKVKRVLPEAVVQQVYARAGGVPLFVEEFTRMVQESGVADQEGGRGDMFPGHAIPATLQDLMMTRLDRMEGERDVAQLASVLGREFAYEVLAAVTSLDEPTLQIELAKLVQEEILYPKGRPPRCSYIFKHALLEDALYNTLVTTKRQQFHRQIAEVLAAKFPQTTDTQPELIAHHFSEAGLAEESVGYWLKAGLRGLERSANVEAIGHLTKGLSIVRALTESPERDAQELQFLNPLGTTYMAARGYAAPEVEPVFRRASELCERLGDPIQQVGVMRGVAGWHLMHCDFKVCTDFAAYAMELAGERKAPVFMMEALTFLGVVALYRGDFTGARQHSERAVSEYDDPERTHIWPSSTGEDCGLPCRNYLALTLWHSGYPDQALQLSRRTIALARTIGHPFSLAYALSHAGNLRQSCQLGEEAQAAGEEQIAIATEQGFALWHATGTLCRGGGLVLQGNLEGGLPLLVEGIECYRASGAELGLSEYLRQLGDAYTRAGDFKRALTTLNDGLSFAQQHDERFQEAELHRLRGELHLAETDDQSAAEECFRTAIETARRQQSKAWELRATTSLARLRQRQGRDAEGRDALAAVYETYTEGFATPDLADARAVLEGRATEKVPARARAGPVDPEPRSEAHVRIEDPRVDHRVEGPHVRERVEGPRFAERVESALLGESAAVRALRAAIAREATRLEPLLLTGPPGAGHDAVARALHDASGRSGPFISVSCPEFRTQPRATLARVASPDLRLATRLTEAPGGTLFLDAVHELPSQLRPALQQWLARESTAPDVRVIASTTRDLVRDAQSGPLDPVMRVLVRNRITLPALVDRREDIPLLVDHYVRIHGQQQGKPVDGVSSASLARLEAHVWSGNLRELCDVLERAVLRARSRVLDIDDALLEESVAVGNYRLIEQLGAGGMGEVWLARHRLLARPAAVKLVRHDAQSGAAQEELVQRFQREARVTAGLRSPHTVQLYDFGVSESGSFYYVMELLVGLDLHRIVSRFGPQPAERVIMLLRQACRSLADAHGHGLVHRDIKPANLFVTQLGWDYDYLKVLDFGMVTDRPGRDATLLSGQGIVRGTPAFMAPEQVLGGSRIDGRADLYSLACTAYWALTGRLPFEASTPMQMLLHHAQSAPLPPSQVSELPIPRPLETLLMKCLAKDPAERSTSALDFDKELTRIRCEQPWTDERAREWWATHAPDIMAAHERVRDEQ